MNDYDKLFSEKREAIEEILQNRVKDFMEKLSILAKGLLGEIEADYLPYLPDDLFLNLRNRVKESIKYGNVACKEIRDKIFQEHREEIIKDLNQDLIKRIEELDYQLARANGGDCK
uniref:Uncharacterized protein n=1 Tax=viral metagenome TaxID=1070528 RepID=A0A6M3K3H6_9ZZZZ